MSPKDKKFHEFLKVFTWNVEGKSTPEDIDKTINDNVKQDRDIVCLQEANLPSAGEDTKNFKWLCSGVFGSAVLVNKASTVVEAGTFQQICDQICVAEITFNKKEKLKIISCYIPPHTDYLSEELWLKLSETIKAIPTNITFILTGDFNAQIGLKDCSHFGNGYRPIGDVLHHDVSNENGVKLIKLAEKAHLKLGNTLRHSKNKYYTYQNGQEKSQQSYIIVGSSLLAHFYSLSSFWIPDHKHAVIGSCLKIAKPFGWPEVPKDGEVPSLIVSNWNTQGASPATVDKLFSEHNLPVICVQELFLTSSDNVQTDNYTWFTTTKPWAKNVGILIQKSPHITLSNFQSLSECLCVGDLSYHGDLYKLISCYLPLANDSRHETVSTELIKLVKGIPEGINFFVVGDFNNEILESQDEKDKNGLFLKQLVKEANLAVKTRGDNFVTRTLETKMSNPHHILVPETFNKKIFPRLLIKWIPFFNNAIISFPVVYRDKSLTNEGKLSSLKSEKEATWCEEVRDGIVHLIRVHNYHDLEDIPLEDVTFFSPEDLEKFKNTPPSTEDLYRIVGDFVLYYKPDNRTKGKKSQTQILGESFIENKLGKLLQEDEIVQDEAGKDTKKIIRIKLNGILLYEGVDTEDLENREFKRLKKGATESLVNRLGRKFYTIKAKRSFFNKGQAPMRRFEPAYKEVCKVVKKKDIEPTPTITKYMDNFFATDSHYELVFGSDFSREDHVTIRRHARKANLEFRAYRSANSSIPNFTAVWIKRSPQYLRDKLMKTSENMKYFLIPPNNSNLEHHHQYILKYESDNCKDEQRLIQKYINPNNSRGATNKSPTGQKQSIPQSGVSRPKTSVGQRRRRFSRPSRNEGNGKPQYNGSDAVQRSYPPQSQPQFSERERDYYEEYRPQFQERDAVQRSYPPQSQPQFSERERNYYEEYRPQFQERGGRPKNDERQKRQFAHDQESHQAKRPKIEPEFMKVNIPRWRDIAPLILVWPLTVRSQTEERPRFVLEDNFPTEFILGPQNSVAVVVTLPMRNRTEKKFCLSVADGMNKAAKSALQQIVRHSTVIKHNQSYLCDGAVPNFIRYKVPCQTNPRSYVILSRYETGDLTPDSIQEIFGTFYNSFNEDVFFDKDTYTFNEKMTVIEMAPKFNLKVRHFGDSPKIDGRYVCVYKRKPKDEILEEVLKMRGFHPKYTMAMDRLPPRIGLNVF